MKKLIIIVLFSVLFFSCSFRSEMERLRVHEGYGHIYIVKSVIGLENVKKQFPTAKHISGDGFSYYVYVED